MTIVNTKVNTKVSTLTKVHLGSKLNISLSPPSLKLTFDNIVNADVMVGGDASDVSNWNTFFSLPTYGTEFSFVIISGNDVSLIGGANIILKESLFGNSAAATNLIHLDDVVGCIVAMEADVFGWNGGGDGCGELLTVNFAGLTTMSGWGFQFNGALKLREFTAPVLLNLQQSCFDSCSLDKIDISSCTNLGSRVFDWGVIDGIEITIPSSLMTSNGGNPDANIQYLIDNCNPVITLL